MNFFFLCATPDGGCYSIRVASCKRTMDLIISRQQIVRKYHTVFYYLKYGIKYKQSRYLCAYVCLNSPYIDCMQSSTLWYLCYIYYIYCYYVQYNMFYILYYNFMCTSAHIPVPILGLATKLYFINVEQLAVNLQGQQHSRQNALKCSVQGNVFHAQSFEHFISRCAGYQ